MMTQGVPLPPSQLWYRVSAGFFTVVAVLWAIASLFYPFGWDQGIIALVGDSILQGGMPYRDSWDMKGPVAFLWFALAQALFGKGMLGIRALDLIMILWAAIAIGRAGGRLTRPAAAWWISIAVVLVYASLSYFHLAQPDGVASLALGIVLSALLVDPTRRRTIVAAAAVIGVCTLVKPLYIGYLGIPVIAVLFSTEQPLRSRATTLVALGTACAIPIVLVVLWFVARGALGDLIDVHLRYTASNYSRVASIRLLDRVLPIVKYLSQLPQGTGLVFLPLGVWAAWQRDRRAATLLALWFAAGIIVVGVQAKFYVYHWTVIFPPAVLLMAYGIEWMLPTRRTDGTPGSLMATLRAAGGMAATALLLGQYAVSPARDIVHWAKFVARVDSPTTYYHRFTFGRDPYFADEQIEAARYLESHTEPGDPIALYGYNSTALYLSNRPNATRFTFSLPLFAGGVGSPFVQKYRAEWMTAMTRAPKYIIVGLRLKYRSRDLTDWPEFYALLTRDFAIEKSFGIIDLWRRRSDAVGAVGPTAIARDDELRR